MDSKSQTILWHVWTEFTPAEINLFNSVSKHLTNQRFRLVLGTPSPPPPDQLNCEYYVFPTSPLSLAPNSFTSNTPGNLANLLCPIDELVESDDLWQTDVFDQETNTQRKLGLDFITSIISEAFAMLEPSLVLIWNGHHPIEHLLHSLAKKENCPVLFVERGPFPQTLFVDKRGISADSKFVQQKTTSIPATSKWLDIWDRFKLKNSESRDTWWKQPEQLGKEAWRSKLNIPNNAIVVLFAGQLDQDSQCFRFSPLFPSNIQALKALYKALPQEKPIYIIGKQHPKSHVDSTEFQEILGDRGQWTNELSLSDALKLADRVVAVNSTVLYEAALRNIPILSMGQWLGMGSDAAYEVSNLNSIQNTVSEWINDTQAALRKRSLRNLGAKLLECALFNMVDDNATEGTRGAQELATEIIQHIHSSAPTQPPRFSRKIWNPHLLSQNWTHSNHLATQLNQAKRQEIRDTKRHANQITHCALKRCGAEARSKEVWIWGAGNGGQLTETELKRRGTTIHGFIISSGNAKETVNKLPVLIWPAHFTPERHFIIVVTIHSKEIEALLHSANWIPEVDYEVIDLSTVLRFIH